MKVKTQVQEIYGDTLLQTSKLESGIVYVNSKEDCTVTIKKDRERTVLPIRFIQVSNGRIILKYEQGVNGDEVITNAPGASFELVSGLLNEWICSGLNSSQIIQFRELNVGMDATSTINENPSIGDWEIFGETILDIDKKTSKDSEASLSLQKEPNSGKGGIRRKFLVEKDRTYNLTYWAKMDFPKGYVHLGVNNIKEKRFLPFAGYCNNTDWNIVNEEFHSLDNEIEIVFYASGEKPPAALYIDNLSIRKAID